MATNGHQIRESFVAGADLSSDQFRFVKMSNADRTVVGATNGDAAVGVLINDPVSGQAATVVTHGRVQVLCGNGGLTAGDDVGVDGNGAAVTAASNDIIVGVCIDSAAANEYATIDFFRGGNVA